MSVWDYLPSGVCVNIMLRDVWKSPPVPAFKLICLQIICLQFLTAIHTLCFIFSYFLWGFPLLVAYYIEIHWSILLISMLQTLVHRPDPVHSGFVRGMSSTSCSSGHAMNNPTYSSQGSSQQASSRVSPPTQASHVPRLPIHEQLAMNSWEL